MKNGEKQTKRWVEWNDRRKKLPNKVEVSKVLSENEGLFAILIVAVGKKKKFPLSVGCFCDCILWFPPSVMQYHRHKED